MTNILMRPIRSFVLRQGRMTPFQKEAVSTHWAEFGLTADSPVDFATVFGRQAPCVLEIGFGMGESLITLAHNTPDTDFIGIEVHAPGVGKCLASAKAHQLTNLKVFSEDACIVLEKAILSQSLDKVLIYFPDPWPKKRHHKRRLIQPAFIEQVRQKLKVGGTLHLATDWQPYAEHMVEVLEANSGMKNKFGEKQFAPPSYQRYQTKFERRGQRLGHAIWDLVYLVL